MQFRAPSSCTKGYLTLMNRYLRSGKFTNISNISIKLVHASPDAGNRQFIYFLTRNF